MRGLISAFILLAVLLLVTNVCILVGVKHYKVRVDRQFEVTEERFVDLVGWAVTNYLSSVLTGVVSNRPSSTSSLEVSSAPLDDAYTFYDYRHSQWRFVCDDVRYGSGDYFRDYLVVAVSEGKVYCQKGDTVTIFRPRRRRSEAVGPERLARRIDDAPLD